jgi:hypothetical protein
VLDLLYDGKRQLDLSLKELLTTTEVALELTENERKMTILRIDGGGGDSRAHECAAHL